VLFRSDEVEVGFGRDEAAELVQCERFVVGDQDFQFHLGDFAGV
jgi:hypothetical protein